MTNDQIIIITTNGLFQVILFLFLKNYLPSYFNEKGRNLATKEDIGTITKIVESVKLGNNAQLEKIKTKLSLVSKTQEIIYDDERKAIIEFLGTVSEFYESNINIPNETNTTEGFAYMQEQIRTLEKEYSRVQIANSKLQLFCFESKILEAAKPVMTELAKIAGHTQMFRFKVLGNQRMTKLLEEQVRSSPNSMDTNYKIDIYYKEHNQTVEEFYKMKIDFYKDYIDMYSNLSLICKEYLKTKQPLSHFEKN